MKVKQNLVSSNMILIKCPYKMVPEFITVHNTAMDAPASNEIKYMISNGEERSYHFAIDDKEIIQGLPLDRNGWHAGDGANGTGNRKSIGIEICYSKSGGERYRKAENNAIKFIAKLLKERSWGIERVKKHQDWSGKYCPHRILSENRWNDFLKTIEKELDNMNDIQDIQGHWAQKSIEKAIKKGIMKGYGDNTFKPDEIPTRAQLAVILDRLGLLD